MLRSSLRQITPDADAGNADSVTNNDANIELSGASHASLEINGKLDVSLSGASSLGYGGNPTLGRLDVTGASSIKQKVQK
jgi:hypothetical protein